MAAALVLTFTRQVKFRQSCTKNKPLFYIQLILPLQTVSLSLSARPSTLGEHRIATSLNPQGARAWRCPGSPNQSWGKTRKAESLVWRPNQKILEMYIKQQSLTLSRPSMKGRRIVRGAIIGSHWSGTFSTSDQAAAFAPRFISYDNRWILSMVINRSIGSLCSAINYMYLRYFMLQICEQNRKTSIAVPNRPTHNRDLWIQMIVWPDRLQIRFFYILGQYTLALRRIWSLYDNGIWVINNRYLRFGNYFKWLNLWQIVELQIPQTTYGPTLVIKNCLFSSIS